MQPTYPHVQPFIRFLSVRPEVCPWVSNFPTSSFLQIPSHDGHPCRRLTLSRYRADLGLAPLRNVRRQAHQNKELWPSAIAPLFYVVCTAVYTFIQPSLFLLLLTVFGCLLAVISRFLAVFYSVGSSVPPLCPHLADMPADALGW